MTLIDYIASKNETWYNITQRLTEGMDDPLLVNGDGNRMKQKVLRILRRDASEPKGKQLYYPRTNDVGLAEYQMFAGALGMSLKQLLTVLGRLD